MAEIFDNQASLISNDSLDTEVQVEKAPLKKQDTITRRTEYRSRMEQCGGLGCSNNYEVKYNKACISCQKVLCPDCSDKHINHELIPSDLNIDIKKSAIFRRIDDDMNFCSNVADILGVEDDSGIVLNYIVFRASKQEIEQIKVLSYNEEKLKAENEGISITEWNKKKEQIKKRCDFEVKELRFYQFMAKFFEECNSHNKEWCCWNFNKAETIERKMNEEITLSFSWTVKDSFGLDFEFFYLSKFSVKSLPSRLYSVFNREISHLSARFLEGEHEQVEKYGKLILSEDDRRYCERCLKTSYLFHVYRMDKTRPWEIVDDERELGDKEKFRIGFLLRKTMEAPFNIKFKIYTSEEFSIQSLLRTIRRVIWLLFRPLFLFENFLSNPEGFISSMLWLLNILAGALHVYPLTTIIFLGINYLGYLGATDVSYKKIYERAHIVNAAFLIGIFAIYGIMSIIFDQFFALTFLSVFTFILLFLGNAYYIVAQTLDFKNTISKLYQGDPKKKRSPKNPKVQKDFKEIRISKFFKNLDQQNFSAILSMIYFEIDSTTSLNQRLFILEISTTIGFVYILIITILKYIVHIVGLSSQIGTGTSYLIEMIGGKTTYGILLVFVLVVNVGIFYAKIYINLQMTKIVDQIFAEMDHIIELLKFIEATPDIIRDKNHQELHEHSQFTSANLGIKFHDWYKMETISVLEAFDEQMKLEKLKNNEIIEDMTVWIVEHSKKSRLRLEFVRNKFSNLTEMLRFKLFGVLEVDSSLLCKLLAAGATATATSIIAFIENNVNIK